MRLVRLTLVLPVLLAGAAGAADEEPSTTPYRPSVSTPAALSAPGWLEVEAGWQHDKSGGARRDSIPLTLKLAFDEDWGIRLGNEPWVRLRSEGDETRSGFGDTGIVLKRRFGIAEDHALGLEAGVTLPTGKGSLGFGSGKPDYAVNAIYSGDFGPWHTDVNLLATRLGAPEPGTSRTAWLFAASLSRQLDERWGLVGEFAGTRRSGVEDSRQLLFAASYNVDRRLTLDAGAARSIRRGDSSWQAFTGLTWLAARLF